ncbi:unnamed protein product [Lathyrus oleraceus]
MRNRRGCIKKKAASSHQRLHAKWMKRFRPLRSTRSS